MRADAEGPQRNRRPGFGGACGPGGIVTEADAMKRVPPGGADRGLSGRSRRSTVLTPLPWALRPRLEERLSKGFVVAGCAGTTPDITAPAGATESVGTNLVFARSDSAGWHRLPACAGQARCLPHPPSAGEPDVSCAGINSPCVCLGALACRRFSSSRIANSNPPGATPARGAGPRRRAWPAKAKLGYQR